jgi:hypothetical protein
MITRDDYRGFFPDKNYTAGNAYLFSDAQIIPATLSYLKTIWNNFGLFILLISLIGIRKYWKNKSYRGYIIQFLFIGIFLGVYVTFVPTENLSSNRMMLGISQRQYVPGYTYLGIFFPIGLLSIADYLRRKKISKTEIVLIGASTCVLMTCYIYSNFTMGYQRNNKGVSLYAKTLLQDAEKNSVIVCSSDLACFSLIYQSVIEKIRPDVTVLFQNPKARYYFIKNHKEFIGYLFSTNPYFYTQEVIWNSQKKPTYIINIDKYYEEFIGLDGTPFYTIPHSLMYQVSIDPNNDQSHNYESSIKKTITNLNSTKTDKRNYLELGNKDYFSSVCKNAAQRFIKLAQKDNAIDAINCALMFSDDKELFMWRKYIDKFIANSKYPENTNNTLKQYESLSMAALNSGNAIEAESNARKALYLDPKNTKIIDLLIKIYNKYNYAWLSQEMTLYKEEVATLLP